MNGQKRIIAIVQARMGSTRLPGKILMRLQGKPMLWHVINRLKSCKLINKILVATTTDKKDAVTAKFCKLARVSCFRGLQDDVLDRYYRAARLYGADAIVRVTADCPLIDYQVVDRVIKYYKKNSGKVDYVSNTLKPTYPRGLDAEVFSFNALEKAWLKAKKAYQREHVTPYIYEHPGLFRVANITNVKDLSSMRWTVDEKKDFKFVEEVYNKLYKKRNRFLMKDILRLLEKNPGLGEINKDVKQKRLFIR